MKKFIWIFLFFILVQSVYSIDLFRCFDQVDLCVCKDINDPICKNREVNESFISLDGGMMYNFICNETCSAIKGSYVSGCQDDSDCDGVMDSHDYCQNSTGLVDIYGCSCEQKVSSTCISIVENSIDDKNLKLISFDSICCDNSCDIGVLGIDFLYLSPVCIDLNAESAYIRSNTENLVDSCEENIVHDVKDMVLLGDEIAYFIDDGNGGLMRFRGRDYQDIHSFSYNSPILVDDRLAYTKSSNNVRSLVYDDDNLDIRVFYPDIIEVDNKLVFEGYDPRDYSHYIYIDNMKKEKIDGRVQDLKDIDGKLAYSVDTGWKNPQYIVYDGIKQKEYDYIDNLIEFDGTIAYLARDEVGSLSDLDEGYLVIGQDEFKLEDNDYYDYLSDVCGKIFYVQNKKYFYLKDRLSGDVLGSSAFWGIRNIEKFDVINCSAVLLYNGIRTPGVNSDPEFRIIGNTLSYPMLNNINLADSIDYEIRDFVKINEGIGYIIENDTDYHNITYFLYYNGKKLFEDEYIFSALSDGQKLYIKSYDQVHEICLDSEEPYDLDNDGYSLPEDCNDNDAKINPHSEEICNDYLDNNCNGQIDEGCEDNKNGLIFWGRSCYNTVLDGASGCQSIGEPREIPNMNNIKMVAAGSYHTCAVMEDDTVQCWGRADWGQLGDYHISSYHGEDGPHQIPNFDNIKNISAGERHTCAIMENETVQCWGYGNYGLLGDGDVSGHYRDEPFAIPGLYDVKQISAGAYHTCALLKDGRVKCWGDGRYGALGDGDTSRHFIGSPIFIPDLSDVKQIETGYYYTCALLKDSTVKCWGNGNGGKLGDGNISNHDVSRPQQIPGLYNVKQITAGNVHTCALMKDSSVKCWGNGQRGKLGDGNIDSHYVGRPQYISDLINVKQIIAGYSYTCALMTDETVRCWGYGYVGRLGDGNINEHSVGTPKQVPNLNNVKQLYLAAYNAFAIVGDQIISSIDKDDDGYNSEEDCNDNDPNISPGAEEICDDDIDNDCDQGIDENCGNICDTDGDGHDEFVWCITSSNPNDDCDDNDPSINPSADEICLDNVDNDCDDHIDLDDTDCANSGTNETIITGKAYLKVTAKYSNGDIAGRAKLKVNDQIVSEDGYWVGGVDPGSVTIYSYDITGGDWYTLDPYQFDRMKDEYYICTDQEYYQFSETFSERKINRLLGINKAETYQRFCDTWEQVRHETFVSQPGEKGVGFLNRFGIYPDAVAKERYTTIDLNAGEVKEIVVWYDASESYYVMNQNKVKSEGYLPLTSGDWAGGGYMDSHPFMMRYEEGYDDSDQTNDEWDFVRVKTKIIPEDSQYHNLFLVHIRDYSYLEPTKDVYTLTNLNQFLLKEPHQGTDYTYSDKKRWEIYYTAMKNSEYESGISHMREDIKEICKPMELIDEEDTCSLNKAWKGTSYYYTRYSPRKSDGDNSMHACYPHEKTTFSSSGFCGWDNDENCELVDGEPQCKVPLLYRCEKEYRQRYLDCQFSTQCDCIDDKRYKSPYSDRVTYCDCLCVQYVKNKDDAYNTYNCPDDVRKTSAEWRG